MYSYIYSYNVGHVFYEASAQNIDKYRAQTTRGVYTDMTAQCIIN